MTDLYFDNAALTAMGSMGLENPRHYQEWRLSSRLGDEAIHLRIHEGNELIDIMRDLSDGQIPIRVSVNISPAPGAENET